MFRSRSKSIDLIECGNKPKQVHDRRQSSGSFKLKTSFLCGFYTAELSSSIFYYPEYKDSNILNNEKDIIRNSYRNELKSNNVTGSNQGVEKKKTINMQMNKIPHTLVGNSNITLSEDISALLNLTKNTTIVKKSEEMPEIRSPKSKKEKRGSLFKSNSFTKLKNKMTFQSSKKLENNNNSSKHVVLCEAVAVRDCNPSPYDKHALPFRKGERLAVFDMNPNGTWIGSCQGREGHFKFIDVCIDRCLQHHPAQHKLGNTKYTRSKSVSDLLSEINLENLTGLFILNGYDCAEDLEYISDDDLEYLGINDSDTKDLLLEAALNLQQKKDQFPFTTFSHLDLKDSLYKSENSVHDLREPQSFLHSYKTLINCGV